MKSRTAFRHSHHNRRADKGRYVECGFAGNVLRYGYRAALQDSPNPAPPQDSAVRGWAGQMRNGAGAIPKRKTAWLFPQSQANMDKAKWYTPAPGALAP